MRTLPLPATQQEQQKKHCEDLPLSASQQEKNSRAQGMGEMRVQYQVVDNRCDNAPLDPKKGQQNCHGPELKGRNLQT